MVFTIPPATSIIASGFGRHARRNALAASIILFSSQDDAIHTASTALTPLPRMRFAGTIRFVSDEAGTFMKGRKPPGLILIPKTPDLPCNTRENLLVLTPPITHLLFSNTR